VGDVLTSLAQDLRRRDLIGHYDEAHVMLLLPELTATEAAQRVTAMVAALTARGIDAFAGIAASNGTRTFRQVLDDADERLAEARYLRQPVVRGSQQTPHRAPNSLGTVLIAEDDPDVMRILDSQLKAAGYQTIMAFDGEQALEAIRERGPDVALLDIMMPKKTGFDVLTALSATSGPKPKVVVLSGQGREADVTRAFALGAEDYVTKPFSPDELIARLNRLRR
jgi:two-component system phosphate regulon response regulator PhoB